MCKNLFKSSNYLVWFVGPVKNQKKVPIRTTIGQIVGPVKNRKKVPIITTIGQIVGPVKNRKKFQL